MRDDRINWVIIAVISTLFAILWNYLDLQCPQGYPSYKDWGSTHTLHEGDRCKTLDGSRHSSPVQCERSSNSSIKYKIPSSQDDSGDDIPCHLRNGKKYYENYLLCKTPIRQITF